jgi:hypothetical protein
LQIPAPVSDFIKVEIALDENRSTVLASPDQSRRERIQRRDKGHLYK